MRIALRTWNFVVARRRNVYRPCPQHGGGAIPPAAGRAISVGPMQIAHQILVLLHLIGFAALLGGLLVQLRAKGA